MRIVSNHRLYEDFLDDLGHEDLTSQVSVDDVAFTNWLIADINGISKQMRRSKAEFDKRLNKFDAVLRRMLDMMPQIEIVAAPEYWPNMTAKKHGDKPYEEYSADEIDGISNIQVRVKINLTVSGAQFIQMYIRLYKLLCSCTQHSFDGAKVADYGIDPSDYTKPHGTRILFHQVPDIENKKNSKSMHRFVETLAMQATGQNFRPYVKKWFESSDMTPEIHSVCKRFRMNVADLIIGEPEGNVIFVTVPKGVTLDLENADIIFMHQEEEKMGKKFFFTIDGTLNIYVNSNFTKNIHAFLWDSIAKNVGTLKITLDDPQPIVTQEDKESNPLNISMLQIIGRLEINIKKYQSYWTNWSRIHSIPYVQPKLVLNPCMPKPKEIIIKDANVKK